MVSNDVQNLSDKATKFEHIEQHCSVYMRKWFEILMQISNTAIYWKMEKLSLPIASITYKTGESHKVLMLRPFNDIEICDNLPEIYKHTKRGKLGQQSVMLLTDIVGVVQVVTRKFTSFCSSINKHKRDAVCAVINGNISDGKEK